MKQIDETKLAAEETLHNTNINAEDTLHATTVNSELSRHSSAIDAELTRHSTALTGLLSDLPAVVTPPPVVVPPPVTTTPYQQTVRYGLALNAYKINQSGFTVGSPVNKIPDQKSKNDMIYAGSNPPILSGTLPVYTKEGLIFLENEANVNYQSQISNSPPYPQELWMVMAKPDFFIFESWQNIWNVQYLGDLGSATNGIRVRVGADNSSDNAWNFTNAVIPTQQFFVLRLRLTAVAGNKTRTNAELWVNGVKVIQPVQMTSAFNPVNILAIGSTTNNEYVGWAEYINMPPITDAQATQVYAEMNAEYNFGQTIQLPFADNIQFATTGNTTAVGYRFNNPLGFPEDVSKRKIRYVVGGSNGISNATYNHAYDNVLTIPMTSNFRIEITVYDTQGNYFSIPSSKALNLQ